MRICITGSFGNYDIGDEAMLTEDLAYVLGDLHIPRRQVALVGWQPDYVAHYHDHPRNLCFSSLLVEKGPTTGSNSWRRGGWVGRVRERIRGFVLRRAGVAQDGSEFRRLKEFVRNCDAALVTGGGTVNTRDAHGASIRRMHALVTIFRSFNKPVFMSGQTIGPLGISEEHDRLAKEIIESVDVLTTRDSHYSARYLALIGAKPKRFLETFDDAYCLPYREESLPPEVSEFIEQGPCAAVNVTDYTADTPQKRAFVAELCEHLLERHDLRVVLVSHAPSDLGHLYVIRDTIANAWKSRILLPDTRQWRDRRLKRLISRCAVAIGGRYHFIVFAGTSNTPFVGMCGNHYSYIKQDGFARALGLEELILTEKETWVFQTVAKHIDMALRTKLALDARFTRPSTSMQEFGRWLDQVVSGRSVTPRTTDSPVAPR